MEGMHHEEPRSPCQHHAWHLPRLEEKETHIYIYIYIYIYIKYTKLMENAIAVLYDKYLVPEFNVVRFQHEVVLLDFVCNVPLHLGDCQTRPE